ncbi:hypothetical protein D5086_020167 [Populus alba]|uniref:Jacalin-type lectin domain-containing protein n=3 Tax=Populus TaxID=3689 RepID=A0A4V6AC74_POPAL|nr:inactive protein RESTRICTED TEV MOVEMENT 1-like isoform X2 [Populus alba]KAJ6982423.1 inactive protein RESTRICTED TEV MOVEMENT 1-like isoform X2 [Populus alba x Populus x berolinensis]TKS14976.1 hypothetical protein D5086_0000036430 [Populus alba]
MIKLQAGSYLPSYSNDKGFDWDHKGRTEISHIYISHDFRVIRFIEFQYVEESGVLSKLSPTLLEKNSFGSGFIVVKLDYPHEFLKGISGRGVGNVNSLTFTTNRGTYGPFGRKEEYGPEFDFQTGDKPLFAGLHGSFDGHGLKTIGIYVNPEKASL